MQVCTTFLLSSKPSDSSGIVVVAIEDLGLCSRSSDFCLRAFLSSKAPALRALRSLSVKPPGPLDKSEEGFQYKVSWEWERRKSNIIFLRFIMSFLPSSGVIQRLLLRNEPVLVRVCMLVVVGVGVSGLESVSV